MSKKNSAYIIWAVVVTVLVGGFILIISGGDQSSGNLAPSSQDHIQPSNNSNHSDRDNVPTVEELIDRPIEEVGGGTEGPYLTTGEEAEDSNFFIPGDVGNLEAILDNSKATVVWVSAPWCEICKSMRPFVWKSANKFAEEVALVEIDLPENFSILTSLGVFGTPTFMVFDSSGEEAFRFNGGNESIFEQQLAKAAALN